MKKSLPILFATCFIQLAFSQISITGVNPSANSTSLAVDGNIQVTFDAAIDGTTLAENIFLRGEQTGLLPFTTSGAGSAVITIDPTIDFLAGENIFLTVTTGIQSVGAAALGADQSFQFKTVTTTAYNDPPTLRKSVIHTPSVGPQDVFAIDMDSDGDMDMISVSGFRTYWYENDGSENFTSHQIGTFSGYSVYPADVDGDSDMDIIIGHFSLDNVIWLENDGSENFTENELTTAADGLRTVSASDVNGDGHLDIISLSTNDRKIRYFENDGSETFSENEIYTFSTTPSFGLQAIDIDLDGDIDILAASEFGDEIIWLENDGSEVFTENSVSTEVNNPVWVSAIDLDEDGDVDVLGTDKDDEVAWFENNGSQTFTKHVIASGITDAVRVISDDLDGDADLDIIVISQDDELLWYKNDGSENFSEALITTEIDYPTSVRTADINGDGRLDLITASFDDKNVTWYENKLNESPQLDNMIPDQSALAYVPFSYTIPSDIFSDPDGTEFLNYSASLSDDSALPSWLTFNSDLVSFSGTASNGDAGTISVKVIVDDPNGATASDIFDISITVPSLMTITAASPSAFENYVSQSSNIEFTFSESIESATLNSTNAIIRGNQSGLIAGVWSGGGTSVITFNPTTDFKAGETIWVTLTTGLESTGGSILEGAKSYQFNVFTAVAPTSPALIVKESSLSTSAQGATELVATDLDSDGDLDAVVASGSSLRLDWYENDGSQSFTRIQVTGLSRPTAVYTVDLDEDGDMDILSGTESSAEVVWMENDGSESFTKHVITDNAADVRSVRAADLDGDGDLDVISASQDDDKIAWYKNDGSQNFTALTITTSVDLVQSVYTADVDGDMDIDIISASFQDDKIAWYKNDGAGNFTETTIATDADGGQSVFALDLDDDGDVDILSAEKNADRIRWFENDGSESFTPHELATGIDGARSVHAGDLDGDGDMDISVGAENGNEIIWLENDGSESFTKRLVATNTVAVTSVVMADIDGDDDLDLFSTFANTVEWYINKANTAPTVENAIDDQSAIANVPFSFTVPQNTFEDPDGVEFLTYTSTLSDDSALPDWLDFDEESHQFTGTADPEDVGTIMVKVTVTDPAGASVSDEFDIEVSQPPLMVVTDFSPATNSNGAAANANIQLVFDKTIDAGTLTSSTIIVHGNLSGVIEGAYSGGGTSVITFDPTTDFQPNELVHVTVTSELNGEDGSVLATTNTFSFLTASGAGSAIFARQPVVSSSASAVLATSAIDLDEDGDTDILAALQGGGISWYVNDGSQGFTETVVSGSTTGISDVFPVDLDLDGDFDLVASIKFDGEIAWFENDGSESFTEHLVADNINGAEDVYVIDMDGDGDLDIASASSSDASIRWYENNGLQSFTTHFVGTESLAPSVFAADVDSDGDVDLLTARGLGWYENDGLQNFTKHDITTDADNETSVFAIDLDGDNDLDVISSSSEDDKIAWYENDGSELFTQHTITTGVDGAKFVNAADLDGDGDIDVFAVAENGNAVYWLENDGSQSFTEKLIASDINRPFHVIAADIDGDLDLDLITGSFEDDEIIWFENRPNIAPVLDNAIADQSANEDEAFSFEVPSDAFSDADGDELSYSAVQSDDSALPVWLTFDENIREFSGTPIVDDVGTITVKVTADDGLGGTASDEFDLEVLNTNDAPVLDQPIPDRTAVALNEFTFTFDENTFSDEDGDDLSYSAELSDGSSLPAWLTFTGSTRTFDGTPVNDDVETLMIKVIADDGNGGSIDDEFELDVVFTNEPPVVDNPIADQTASEDTPFELIFDANTFSDPNGDPITLSASLSDNSSLPSWLSFDPTDRKFSGTPLQENVGTITIKVTATDPGDAAGSDEFDLEVQSINDIPVLLMGITDQNASAGNAFSFQIDAGTFGDEDGDVLIYTALLDDGSPLPDWLNFEASTITFSGTPSMGDAGTISVELFATDPDNESVSDVFDITVVVGNSGPIVQNPIDDQNTSVEESFSFTFPENTFTDPDGDALDYTSFLEGGADLPDWLIFDEVSRNYSGTPAAADEGTYSIVLRAEDGFGGFVEDQFQLTVSDDRQEQTITFGELDERTFGDESFDLTAVASSGLSLSYISSDESVASVSGNTVTIMGAGTTIITASQDGNDNYFSAEDVSQTLIVNKAGQVISFNSPGTKTFGDTEFELVASATSDLDVVFSSSNSSVATISGSTVTIVGAGTTSITAFQGGDADYNSAPSVSRTLIVLKADQTISFSELADIGIDEVIILDASSSSGLAVTFAIEGPAVLNGNELTTSGEGTVSVTASQIGNANYNSAADVVQSFEATNKSTQTITFNAIEAKTFGDSPFSLSATASSGLDVSYSSSDESVATVSGNEVTITGAGVTTITVSQIGDDEFSAAADVSQTLLINKANQTITFESLEEMTFGDQQFSLSATTTSGLPVSYSILDESVATISGSEVTITGAGATMIIASQAGNENFEAAESLEQQLIVNKADQTISILLIEDREITDDPFDVVATVDSGLPLSYTVTGPASIEGVTITLDGSAGTVNVMVSQEGDNNYNPTESSTSFEVIEMALGFEDEISIKIYPNPVSNFLIIQSKKSPDVKIYTIGGELIMQKEDATKPISLQHLKAGMYLIEILVDGTSSISRFYKSN
ncbi:MAG: FG-GAP-like repeat-containing protein [Cyclobacteriaceae bacterium]